MKAIAVMSALAQPTRLAVFSLLVRAGTGGMTAGDLAAELGTPSNTMSAHLTVLNHAGLTSSRRSGRNIFYAAHPDMIRQLTVFLVRECCDGCTGVCEHLQSDLDACKSAGTAPRAGTA